MVLMTACQRRQIHECFNEVIVKNFCCKIKFGFSFVQGSSLVSSSASHRSDFAFHPFLGEKVIRGNLLTQKENVKIAKGKINIFESCGKVISMFWEKNLKFSFL